MAVLVHLASADGRVVPRSELFDVVWPRMAVGPDALSQCIVELRKAFQDDARNPSVIETIPKVGVRLVAPVVTLGAPHRPSPVLVALPERSAVPSGVSQSAAPAKRADAGRERHSVAWGIAAVLVAVGGALAAFWSTRSVPAASDPVTNAEFRRITDYVGVEENAAISPDGRFVAFVSDRDGVWDVWLGLAEGGEFRNVTQGAVAELRNPAVRMLSFAPSGSELLFWTKTTDAAGAITDYAGKCPCSAASFGRSGAPCRSSTGHRQPRASSIILLRPAIRCSWRRPTTRLRDARSTPRRPAYTIISRCGRTTARRYFLRRGFRPTRWTSGRCL
jgi:hypothetical protein